MLPRVWQQPVVEDKVKVCFGTTVWVQLERDLQLCFQVGGWRAVQPDAEPADRVDGALQTAARRVPVDLDALQCIAFQTNVHVATCVIFIGKMRSWIVDLWCGIVEGREEARKEGRTEWGWETVFGE